MKAVIPLNLSLCRSGKNTVEKLLSPCREQDLDQIERVAANMRHRTFKTRDICFSYSYIRPVLQW